MKNPPRLALLMSTTLWLVLSLGMVHAEAALAVCPPGLIGAWTGETAIADLLALKITVTESPPGRYTARIDAAGRVEEDIPLWSDGERLRFQSARFPIAFSGAFSNDANGFQGFVHQASTLAALPLARVRDRGERAWTARWNPLGAEDADRSIDLYIEQEPDGVAAYIFFRDQRLPSPWTYGLECERGLLRFREKNLGLLFEGPYRADAKRLELEVTGIGGSAPITFRRREEEPSAVQAARPGGEIDYRGKAPASVGDGWSTAAPAAAGFDVGVLRQMFESIIDGEVTLTHSVLVARHGRLVVEEYFYGFDRDTWHDNRSASKTIASALVGLAVDRRKIDSVDARVLNLLPAYRQLAHWDPRKATITLRHLLAMSSGLDADDWGDEPSAAAEDTYQSQTAERDWIKVALDAPMVADPGARTVYGSANPMLLGAALDQTLDEPVEWFAHRALFAPLGIDTYKWFLTPTDMLYMGGGMYLRPRDMAKFGQLYLDGGTWNGRRVLSEAWVKESTAKHGRLDRARDRNEYGYLWWHHNYEIGDRQVASVEARGAGGQYIFVVSSLDLVAVITSGNYRNGRFRQPEEIMQRFILPAALGGAARSVRKTSK